MANIKPVGSYSGEFSVIQSGDTVDPSTLPLLTGDVTTNASAVSTIANSAVTLAKMASMATASILGRNTAGSGAPEVLSATTVKSILSLSNVENTALSTWAGSTNITTVAAGAITLANMANVATGTIFYRRTAATGVPEVQTLATLKSDLGLTGINSGDQTITLTGDVTGSGTGSFAATIAAGAVTLAKMANIATGSLIGRSTAATGVPEVISIGSGLSLSGGVLSATAGGTGTVTSVSVVPANGISGTVATATTTPAITLSLGAITPSSIASTGAIGITGNLTVAPLTMSGSFTSLGRLAQLTNTDTSATNLFGLTYNSGASASGQLYVTGSENTSTPIQGRTVLESVTGSGLLYSAYGGGNHVWSNGSSRATIMSLSTTGDLTLAGDLIEATSVGISAAGTTQATATVLTSAYNIVTTVAAGSGVVLPTAVAGLTISITNNGTNSLRIYPAVGGQIDTLGTNTFLFLPPTATVSVTANTTTQWNSSLQPALSGAVFINTIASSVTDLSKQIALWATYGFSITSNRLNYVVPTGGGHYFTINGVDIASVISTGMAVTGTFSSSGVATLGAGSLTTTPTLGDSSTKIATTAFVNTPNVQAVASAATVTPTAGNDMVVITAQAAALTLANPTGTWLQGQGCVIRIKDNATARAITYGTNYRAVGVVRPTTTVISKTLYIGIIYNATDTKWDIVSVAQE